MVRARGDMAVAAARLAEIEGGQVAVVDGEVVGEVRLPIGGLMSDRPAGEVADALATLVDMARSRLGVTIAAPFMQLSFLGLSVIPQLRITDKGLVDVDRFELTTVDAARPDPGKRRSNVRGREGQEASARPQRQGGSKSERRGPVPIRGRASCGSSEPSSSPIGEA